MTKRSFTSFSGFLFFFFLLLVQNGKAQEVDSANIQYTETLQIEAPLAYFTTDKLQQVYIVTPQNEVIKYDKRGKEVFRYNNNRLGHLAKVDVTNPFNILLYYPDYLKVITLDRTLSPVGEFNLIDLGVTNVKAIGLSNDNNIWLFDDLGFRLKKVDQFGKVLLESGDLSLLLNRGFVPNHIVERNNMVYVNVPDTGVFIFDNFGRYLSMIELKEVEEFQVIDDQLVFLRQGIISVLGTKTLKLTGWPIPKNRTSTSLINLRENNLFMADANGVVKARISD